MATQATAIALPVRLAGLPRRADYVTLHCLLLAGYALFGKLFAYQGLGDLYIGEIVLLVGSFVFLASPQRWLALRSWHLVPLFGLMVWGAIRTVPYISYYGVEALRDAVIWGYGWFAILIAALIVRYPPTVSRLLDNYGRFVRLFLVLAPVVWLLSTVFGVITLVVHGHTLPVLKSGDLMVHLSGVIAFIYLRIRKVPIMWLLLTPVVFAISSNTRAGILSLGVSLTLLFLFRPRPSRVMIITAIFITAITIATALDVRVKLPGVRREMSAYSVIKGVRSIFVRTGSAEYDGTKRWRLQWWEKIADETFTGQYFWTGKGFGTNIAYSDGLVRRPSDPLRSPHNCEMTFLARAGVPGLTLWLLTQALWLWSMFTRWKECSRNGPDGLAKVFLFLIIYWVAFIINASFDVFLEGPMGGIWFWTLFGAGVGTMIVYDRTTQQTGRASVPVP